MAEGGLPVRVVTEPNAGARGIRVREVVGGLPVAVVDGISGPSGIPVVVITSDGSPGVSPMPVTVVSGSFGPTAPPVAGYDLWLPSDGRKWQDVAGTVAATSDTDPVARWDDYSGGSNHALQATAGKRPLLKKSIVNGQDVTRFDGVDDLLIAACTAQAAQTIFVAVKKRTAPGGASASPFSVANAGSTSQLFTNSGIDATGYIYFSDEAAGFPILGGIASNWNIISLAFASAASATIRVNGGAGVVFDPQNGYSTGLGLGLGAAITSAVNAGSNFSDSDEAEVTRHPSALSLPNHNAMGQYFAAKFGVAWTTAT